MDRRKFLAFSWNQTTVLRSSNPRSIDAYVCVCMILRIYVCMYAYMQVHVCVLLFISIHVLLWVVFILFSKGTVAPFQSMKACRGRRCIAPFILNRGPRRRWAHFFQQLMVCTADQQGVDPFSDVKSVSDI